MSSEGNRTPLQLFTLDSHLQNLHNPDTALEQISNEPSAQTAMHGVDSFLPLPRRDLQDLALTVNPLENDHTNGKTLFQRVQQFIFSKIVSSQFPSE